MKSIFLNILILLCIGGFLSAQTIVNTASENKKAVLEYFGGIYCGYCPDGDQIAEEIKENHPDDVFLINVQTGFFASPQQGDADLRSGWGLELDLLAGNGQWYPAGTINRQVFPNYELGASGTTALGRQWWDYAVDQVLDQTSPVNLGIEATLDLATNTINIYIEHYYTSDCEGDTNYLNIALIQHGVISRQLLENDNYDDHYSHNFLLRDLLTGQWGEEIFPTTAGSFGTRQISYPLPSNFREILVDPTKVEIVAFIAENQQDILTAGSAEVIIPPAFSSHDVNLWSADGVLDICDNRFTPVATIRNDGDDPLTYLEFAFNINGGTSSSFNWEGHLDYLEVTQVELPEIIFAPNPFGNYNLQMEVSSPNDLTDEVPGNNELIVQLDEVPRTSSHTVLLELRTDSYGYETYWEFRDSDDNLIASGGNHNVGANGGGQQTASSNDPGAYDNHSIFLEAIELPGYGCYEFRILDDYADGLCCHFGSGYYRIRSQETGEIIFSGGKFDAEKIDPFLVTEAITATNTVTESEIRVYPNPVSTDQVNVSFYIPEARSVKIDLYDSTGKQVQTNEFSIMAAGQQELNLSTANLPNGMYFMRMHLGKEMVSRKLIISKN